MANSIVGGLFGVTPYDVASQRINDESQLATNFAQLTPQQQGQYGMYAGGAGLVRAASGLLGAEDPAMVQAKQMQQVKNFIAQNALDINTPEGLAQAAQYAQSIGATEGAMYLGQQAMALRKGAAEEQYKLAQAQKALQLDTDKLTDQRIFQSFVQKFGGDETKAAFAFDQYKQDQSERRAAAGAAQFGQEKIGNLTGAQGLVEGYVKKPYERLQAIDETKGFLKMAAEGNTASVPHLKRALVKLAGPDSQIAAKEIAGIAGNAGVAGNVSRAVENFFTGNPTKEDIKLIGQVIGGAERVIGQQYMQGRQQAETVLDAAKLDPRTRAALLPPAYKLPEKTYPNAPKVGTVQNGYRFNGGNPADQNNWSKL